MDRNEGTNRGGDKDHDCVQNGMAERRVIPQRRRESVNFESCHRIKTNNLLNFIESAKLSSYLQLSNLR